MYFSTAVAFAALPFLVGADPIRNSMRNVLSIPLSKRPTACNAEGLVDIHNLQASIYHTVVKFEQGFKAYESNTGKPHPFAFNTWKSNKRRSGATISLTNFRFNSMWFGNISVGTPAAPFTADFVTGSATMFLPGPSCSNCEGHQIYNPTQSSSAKDLETNVTLSFGKGEVSGELFSDNVVAGGFEAANQAFLVASTYSDNFNATTFGADGVVGLAFKEVSPFNATPFFETLVDQGQLEEPVFGFFLAESDSEFIIGGRDSSRFSGDLTYVNVNRTGFWQTKFDALSVNGNNISVTTQNAIIDTGTTFVLGDLESITNLYSEIPGSAQLENTTLWTIPCNTNVTVSLTFGGTTFNISPKTYNLGTITNTSCVGGFSTSAFNTGFWTIGDVFLENVYSEFDFGNLRIGFGHLV